MNTSLSFRQSLGVFAILALATLLASALSAWTGPTVTPPNGNVSAPLNVGVIAQVKSGGLWAASMGTDSGYCIGTSCITTWSQASEIAVGTSLYRCPNITQLSSDSNCVLECRGQVTTDPTCSNSDFAWYPDYDGSYGYKCEGAPAHSCTLLGKLIQ